MLRRLAIAALLALGSATAALAQADPASLPARDAHDGLLIAADPYLDAARYKTRFGKKNPYEAGIIAIEIYFRNDTDKPIQINLESIRLILAPPEVRRQRFGALAPEDVADRVLNKGGPNPTTSRKPLPIPGGGPRVRHSKEYTQLVETLRATAFETDLLPPHGTVHGVFFFDFGGRFELLPYARFYLPNLKFMDSKQPLLYFEIELARATSAPR